MAISWDWMISFAIIIALILGFWAAVSHQRIGDILRDLKDFIIELKDERGEELIYNGWWINWRTSKGNVKRLFEY